MIEHINFAKEMQVPYPVQVENGDIVKLYPGDQPEVYDKAPSGRLYLDGNISVEEDSQSIKDRKNLSENGYLEVPLMITPKGNIHNNPVLSFRGLPVYEKDEFIYGLEEEIDKVREDRPGRVRRGAGAGDDPVHESRRGERDGWGGAHVLELHAALRPD